jgi:hypothetical protein
LKTSKYIRQFFCTEEEIIVTVVVAKDSTIAGKNAKKAISSGRTEFTFQNARPKRNVMCGAQT